ncbi:MAG TPA: hypothetical protein VL147_01740 [Devosia sp.]|nr:hypothetical protein [Devosia sp.]
MKLIAQVVLAAGLGAGGVYAVTSPAVSTSVSRQFGLGQCNIKGNVSISSGEHIYHMPGQLYYAETIIRQEYGERYFCSEAEARAAGWRRSGV